MPVRLLFNMLLQQHNLPLSYVAYETGCSVQALRRLKNERVASIKFETLEGLCEALFCEPGELFEFVPNEQTRRRWAEKRRLQEAKLLERLRTPVIRNPRLIGRTDDSGRIERRPPPHTQELDDLELD